jgi:1,4-alpha-glucan branching enzyme
MLDNSTASALVRGGNGKPFDILGPHLVSGELVIRAILPQASRVAAIDAHGSELCVLERIETDGLFEGHIAGATLDTPYRLRMTIGDSTTEFDDPYRFGPVLGDIDIYLIGEGRHLRLYDKLGAHPQTIDGVAGTAFAVWAPNVRRASVVGDFNDWDGRRHPMRARSGGVWELFIPGIGIGTRYKFEFLGPDGWNLPLKADPYGFFAEHTPATASIVAVPGKAEWHDAAWMEQRAAAQERHAPICVYEVHLGSWKRLDGNRYLTYRELADDLIPYVKFMGFTHIELMPINEHPFDGSWGYQPIGLFAPTSRFGTPEDFANFVDRAHAEGIGVILDWVPGHFPTDAHGLGNFDGTHLFEHADPRQGFQPDWNTLIFNFDRNEVANFLIANALFWLDKYHIDGLRVDAVASMLYLDFSRREGEWVPNTYGGRENLGAIDFLRRANEAVYGEFPGTTTIAEESTSFPNVSRPVYDGGLGFGYKWDLGWMHDTLDFLGIDPIYRTYEQNQLTFSFMYAYDENFMLPLSHDEVVHGKRSLLGKMAGDRWQQFANLRALYGFMYAHPGKKLIFMGGEFAQEREWNHDRSLDWHLTQDPLHAGVQRLIGDLNRTYRGLPALYERDAEQAGIEWIVSDTETNVVAFVRRGKDSNDFVVCVSNFTPVVRHAYRIGVPAAGTYVEAINTDYGHYGGSDVANGPLTAEPFGAHDKPYSIVATLPPLATIFFKCPS